MDLNRKSVQLCLKGIQAEFNKQPEEAYQLYNDAWHSAADNYDKCVAAHYIAHLENEPKKKLEWNQKSLEYAQSLKAEDVSAFMPSLYVNLAHSYELLGNDSQSSYYYTLATEHGLIHQPE